MYSCLLISSFRIGGLQVLSSSRPLLFGYQARSSAIGCKLLLCRNRSRQGLSRWCPACTRKVLGTNRWRFFLSFSYCFERVSQHFLLALLFLVLAEATQLQQMNSAADGVFCAFCPSCLCFRPHRFCDSSLRWSDSQTLASHHTYVLSDYYMKQHYQNQKKPEVYSSCKTVIMIILKIVINFE